MQYATDKKILKGDGPDGPTVTIMAYITKTTRGFCCPERYIQGPGEFNNLAKFAAKFGKKLFAIIDQFFFESLTVKLKELCDGTDLSVETMIYNTEVTAELVEKTIKMANEADADVIIGIGGGKTLDLAKAASIRQGKPIIIVPTTASTDAPTSSLSVIYNDNGEHICEYFYDHSPDLLVVDTEIIANAPIRFLVSGMGDALATWIEARANNLEDIANWVNANDGGYRKTLAGSALAKLCYETLMEKGELAKIAAEQKVITEALEDVIEANILLSGLGFENNGVAGAHAVGDGITALPEGSKSLHGEKVAFGIIAELVAENAPMEEIEEIIDFNLRVGLPVCLSDLGIANSDANIRIIAQASLHSNWVREPFNVDFAVAFAAIRTADALGTRYKLHFDN